MSRNNRVKREAKLLDKVGIDFRDQPTDIREYKENKHKIKPIGFNQTRYLSVLRNMEDELVIGAGSAGTGKTWLATNVAAELYINNHVGNMLLTRPTVQCGEKLGHLPGEIEDKYAPYREPFDDILNHRLGNVYKNDLGKRIRALPLQYMRGKTFHDTVIICDEAQNTTVEQMKMLITRVGENSRLFLCGDTGQSDFTKNNGLAWIMRQIRHQGKRYECIEFTKADSVRSDFCKDMLDMIENEV